MEFNEAFEETRQAFISEQDQRVAARLRAEPWQASYRRDEEDLTLLHEVAMSGKTRELAELLLELGADPNARATHGQLTPLHYACIAGDPDIIDVLLRNGADIEAKARSGSTPLLMTTSARSGMEQETMQLLLDRGAKLDLNTAIRMERQNEVERIIESHPNWQQEALHPNELLHDAIATHNFEIVKLLLDSGISLTPLNSIGMTPLKYARHLRSEGRIVDLLVERGAKE